MANQKSINISEFKAHALRIIAEIAQKSREYVILKRGTPIARIIPFKRGRVTRRGCLKGLIEVKGDIVHFDSSSDWEVLQ